MGTILYGPDSSFAAKIDDFVHMSGKAVRILAEHNFRPLRDGIFNRGGSHGKRGKLYIGVERLGAEVQDGIGNDNAGIGRHQHLIAFPDAHFVKQA